MLYFLGMVRESRYLRYLAFLEHKACFIRRISVASNAIQTKDNEVNHLIIYCLNCIRRDGNATYKTGLIHEYTI